MVLLTMMMSIKIWFLWLRMPDSTVCYGEVIINICIYVEKATAAAAVLQIDQAC
jgi:hypothetical protein